MKKNVSSIVQPRSHFHRPHNHRAPLVQVNSNPNYFLVLAMLLLLLYLRAPPLTFRRTRITAKMFGPDSVMVRAFASEAGGAGSNPGRVIPKTLKMVPVATLLGAQHYKASTGFSSLKKITSMMGAPCNTLFMRCLEYLADWQIQIRIKVFH